MFLYDKLYTILTKACHGKVEVKLSLCLTKYNQMYPVLD
jgi:hypothetical protein